MRDSITTIPEDPVFDTCEDLRLVGEWKDEPDTETRARDLHVPRVVFGAGSQELEQAVKELTRVPVERVMDPDFPRVPIAASGQDLRTLFASGVRSAIVVDDALRPIGAVTAAGVVRAEASGERLASLRVYHAASLGVARLGPDADLTQALEQMASSPDLPVAVVDAEGRLLGGFESHHVVAWLGAGLLENG